MSLDFTIRRLSELYMEFVKKEYSIVPFVEYLANDKYKKTLILRHDVERKVHNALKIAAMEKSLGIRASYYFRYRPGAFNESVIKEISSMGHEIGYHYEDLSAANGDFEQAIRMFKENLALFRRISEVRTICMHGSPLSKWDNRLIWYRYNYHDFGIIGEPFFDVNFGAVLYLTDTGRRWNGKSVSVRDKVKFDSEHSYRSTDSILKALRTGMLPEKVMLNVHTHRWTNNILSWMIEFVGQNSKNIGKRVLINLNH